MGFCPDCGREFPEGIVGCRHCRTPLTDDPPGGGRQARETVALVRLCEVSGVVEGSMWKGALESQGIHPRLVSWDLPAYAGVRWDWSRRGWGEIRVPEDELEEARAILQDFRQAVARMPELSEGVPVEDAARVEDEGAVLEAADRERTTAVRLVHLCPVQDLAEGAMWSGALRSQGLHAVLIAPALRAGDAGWPLGAAGEIRVPADELLEARAVLDDYRHAARRAEPPDSGDAQAGGT